VDPRRVCRRHSGNSSTGGELDGGVPRPGVVSNAVSGSPPPLRIALHQLIQFSPFRPLSDLSYLSLPLCPSSSPCSPVFLPSTCADKSARRRSSSSKGTPWARKRKTSFTPGSSAPRRRLILSGVCVRAAPAVHRCLCPASLLSSFLLVLLPARPLLLLLLLLLPPSPRRSPVYPSRLRIYPVSRRGNLAPSDSAPCDSKLTIDRFSPWPRERDTIEFEAIRSAGIPPAFPPFLFA